MEERPSKRPKLFRGEDDYLPGNIIEVELHNFMTFDHLICKPCSRLNLVIGPNGSGKSSLVCAIALGLGGEPQLLGRAQSVGSYVKRGEVSGYIKISLRGDTEDEPLVITRKINIHNKSEWLFNERTVPKKDVTEVIQRFNIQVNNLTQFLPQDRVCEFAKLTPVQLLEETEKAVGDPQLPIDHSALVKKSRELKEIVRSVEKNGETLSNLVKQNAEQEKDVERVKQRDELCLKAENMKKKLPWLKYDMKKAEYKESEKQESNAKKKLDKAVKTLNDSKAPIEEKKREKGNLDCRRGKLKSLMDVNVEKRRETLDTDSNLEVKIRGKNKEIAHLRNEKASLQQRIAKAKADLATAEQEEKDSPPFEPPKDELKRLGELITEAQSLSKQKRTEKSDLEKDLYKQKSELRTCEDRLKGMEGKKNKLLHNLKNNGAHKIHDAYNWLQEHKSELKKEVYGPVLLEVNISNKEHAEFLEGHVNGYFWKSFITQDSGDRDFLVQNLKHFDVPVLNYVGGDRHQREPFQISQQCKELGIYSRLDQVFDAPNAVKEVMIGQFGLQNSYIGTKETDQRADEVSRLGIFDFWTPETHYRWTKSRYGGHVSASMNTVSRSRLLLCSSDVAEVDRLRSQKKDLDRLINTMEEKIKSTQFELTRLEDVAANYETQREDIHKNIREDKNKRNRIQLSINQKRKKLESLEREDDPEIAIMKLKDKIAELLTERCRNALNFKKFLVEAVCLKREYAEKHMEFIEFDAKIKEMELNLKENKEAAEEALKYFDQCQKEVENHRKRLRAAKDHAESIAKLTPELRAAFREMPTTVEELEAEIQDTISQANSIMFLNPNILAEYEERRRKIEEIGGTLERNKAAQETCLAEINALKEKWLPTLRNLVAQINETFSRNFQEMAVAGEVALDEHGTDFDQYGILIKVKFRQTGQLQVLSAHHQSGGERSVSTILYLVSLQDLTHCPFRVVDEINQGMDPINERKMFQQLVRAASQLNTPQCFLLTPKLLSDLEYSEACSVLNIMNGPWIQQPSQAWSSGESWRAVTQCAGD